VIAGDLFIHHAIWEFSILNSSRVFQKHFTVEPSSQLIFNLGVLPFWWKCLLQYFITS
jgi:hypothetical protein